MPQELRWPQNRTEDVMEEIVKTLTLNSYLSHPAISERNLQDMAIQTYWPNMNRLDAELFMSGVVYLHDETVKEVQN